MNNFEFLRFFRLPHTRVFAIDVIFLFEVAANNKQLSLLTSSIFQTSYDEI